MTRLLIDNSFTHVISTDERALVLIEDVCTITYEYFTRTRFSPRATRNQRNLYYFSRDEPFFPAGWTGKVTKALSRHDLPFEIEDIRKKPKKINLTILALPNDPWEHQKDALLSIEENERGIVQVPTRGGKTLIMALTIASFDVKTIIMVPNITLLEQEYEVFAKVFGADRVGRLGGGYLDYHKDVTVATVPTLHSRQDDFLTKLLMRQAGCLLLDECHHISHGGYKLQNTYFEVVQRCRNAYYRIGLSATPGRTSSLERQLLVAVAGKLIYQIGVEELTERKVLVPAAVDLVVLERNHTPTLKEILENHYHVDVPSRAKIEEVYKQYKIPVPLVPTFKQQLDEKITNHTGFKRLVKFLAEYHASKGRSVIVLVSLVEKGVQMYTEGEFKIENAIGLSGKDANRTEVLDQFRHGDFKILVSTLIREGVDIPKGDILILASVDVRGDTPVIQRSGRILTSHTGKTKARIIDFFVRDQGTLERHSKDRMRLYEKNGFDIQILGKEELERMKNETETV